MHGGYINNLGFAGVLGTGTATAWLGSRPSDKEIATAIDWLPSRTPPVHIHEHEGGQHEERGERRSSTRSQDGAASLRGGADDLAGGPYPLKQEIPPADAWYTALGLAGMAGHHAFRQNVGENKAGKELLKPVDRRVGDAVLGEGQSAGRYPRVLDPDNDGKINEGPTS